MGISLATCPWNFIPSLAHGSAPYHGHPLKQASLGQSERRKKGIKRTDAKSLDIKACGRDAPAYLANGFGKPADDAILIVPGGRAPETVRNEPKAFEIARFFVQDKQPVAAICQDPQILISAGFLQGRRATGYKSAADEPRESGMLFEDREVVVDAHPIKTMQPADPADCMREIIKQPGL